MPSKELFQREFDSDCWLRLHSLPKSKQFAEYAVEWAQLLSRQLTLLKGLSEFSPGGSLILVTESTSGSPEPVERGEWFNSLVSARYLTSVVSNVGTEDVIWTHYFAERVTLSDPRLIAALTLAAGIEGRRILVIAEDASWAFFPYEGGVDILAPSAEFTRQLAKEHSAWLPSTEQEKRIDDGTPVLTTWPEPKWGVQFVRMDQASAHRVVAELQKYEWGYQLVPRVVDPADTLVLELNRSDAQLSRVAITGESERVYGSIADPEQDDFTYLDEDRILVADIDYARRGLRDNLLDSDSLGEFLDEYGYRAPAEAVDGRLSSKYWRPWSDYSGLDGS